MKKTAYPPYQITEQILRLISDIQLLLGENRHSIIQKPSVKLRKENKIKTIHHSLAIEGNTISENQVSLLLEGKKVIGPQKQIQEVKNAILLYEKLDLFNPLSEKDLLKAHKILMTDLIESAGQYRKSAVGILKGEEVSRIAPPAKLIPELMKNIFLFLNQKNKTLDLIKACVFHYELEFIHPFQDGNGRMGRLWQQLLLMRVSPIFEYIPIESMIHQNQKKYYQALEESDVQGNSTRFIEFSLEMILQSLKRFSNQTVGVKPKIEDRIKSALQHFGTVSFTRKDYLSFHKTISTATASRDLAKAVTEGSLSIKGDKAKAQYRKK